jgi:hypothetical protein
MRNSWFGEYLGSEKRLTKIEKSGRLWFKIVEALVPLRNSNRNTRKEITI